MSDLYSSPGKIGRWLLSTVLLAVCFGHRPSLAATPPPDVAFDDGLLERQGWTKTLDPEQFPLRKERKQTKLAAGFVHPNGSRIFVLYSLPRTHVPLSAIDIEPPESLLASLGIDATDSSGQYEQGFIERYDLDAIHWRMTSNGDGSSFLPGSGPAVRTSGIRTMVAFALITPQGEVQHVVLTAFLRGPADTVPEMADAFFGFLGSMEPVAAGGRILSTKGFSEWSHFAEGELFKDMTALLERSIPSLDGGGKMSLAESDRELLDRFLEAHPRDYFANRILREDNRRQGGLVLGRGAREAYLGYLEACLKATDRLSADEEIFRYYADAIREIAPDHPALAPPRPCKPGERWSRPAAPHDPLICSSLDLTFNGERKKGVAWIPESPDEGYRISIEDLHLVWAWELQGWLPESPRDGDVLVQPLTDGPVELRYVEGPEGGLGAWIGAIEQTSGLGQGNLKPGSPCPARMALVDASQLEHPEPSLVPLLYDLTRRQIEWILAAEGPDVSLVSTIDPQRRRLLGTKQAKRIVRRAKVAALCTVIPRN